MRSLTIAWTLALGACLAACNDSTSGGAGGCTDDRECDLPAVCLEGACVVECRRDRECGRGELCIENECRSPDSCARDTDCEPFGLVCDRTVLRCIPAGATPCNPFATPPCSGGRFCNPQGLCVGDAGAEPPTGDASPPFLDATPLPRNDAGPSTQPPPDAGPQPTDMRVPPPPVDAGPDTPDARPRGNRGYGEPCGCAGDCATGFCVENKLRASRTCTDRCDRDDDCPGIDTCIQAQVRPGGSDECPPVDLGLEPGEIVGVCAPNETSLPCNGPQDCTSGICLTPPRPAEWLVPQNICTMRCEGDGKCPSGYSCQAIQANGGAVSVCALDLGNVVQCNDMQQCGGTCAVPAGRNEMEVTLCAQLEAGGSGYCTCSCGSAADCPRGYACQRSLESGDGVRPGICTPLAGYVCPREAMGGPLEPPFECASLQCLGGDDENPRYSRCTSECNDARDCPGGYGCDQFEGQGYCVPR